MMFEADEPYSLSMVSTANTRRFVAASAGSCSLLKMELTIGSTVLMLAGLRPGRGPEPCRQVRLPWSI
jgi:hypothetical protein